MRVTPGGSQTMSKSPDRFPRGAFPAYLDKGRGARVWDVDGNEYVDWICGLGAVPLGYGQEWIEERILETFYDGVISGSLPHRQEAIVAERLVEIIPCAKDNGMVRFTKTGSEACQGAVRVARRATGRDLVIVVGYHGWLDWVQVTSHPHPGIPDCDSCGNDILRVPYNDAGIIEKFMRESEIAAVMLEPCLLEPPKGSYLSDVVTLCTLHGAVSIFDEMVTGFRWARAGGQEYFGIVPDLSVFGKGLGNGMPLAAIVGPERLLRYADVVSGTFGGEVLSLAAAGAVLDEYRINVIHGPIERQWEHGARFLYVCKNLGIPVTGYPVHPKVLYEGEQMALFLQETAKRGLLLHPAGFNVSAALTKDDMEQTEYALAGAKMAMDDGVKLEGELPKAGAFARTGS